jgi:hypothetical protein
MRRLAVLPLILAGTIAHGQEVPKQSVMDLWCGLAFTIVAAEAPSDAPQELVDRFAEGGRLLADRASAIYRESGHSEQSLNARIDALRAEIRTQLDSAEIPDTYSFEECNALIPF